jgi:hypothetical protein
MLNPGSTEWPKGYVDPWHISQPPGGVAPLRHDLALARYLEKRKAYDSSAVRRIDVWAAAIDLCVKMRHGGFAVFRGLRLLPSAWANK